jgi:hypothetical protein
VNVVSSTVQIRVAAFGVGPQRPDRERSRYEVQFATRKLVLELAPYPGRGSTPNSATASLDQLVEHALRKRMVAGSIPAGGSCGRRGSYSSMHRRKPHHVQLRRHARGRLRTLLAITGLPGDVGWRLFGDRSCCAERCCGIQSPMLFVGARALSVLAGKWLLLHASSCSTGPREYYASRGFAMKGDARRRGH